MLKQLLKILCIAQKSGKALRFHVPDQPLLKRVEALHQIRILLRSEFSRFLRRSRPLIAETRNQSLIEKQEPITFKQNALDPVTSSSAEEKQCSFICRAERELVLNQVSKTVNPHAEVSEPAGDIYF